MGRAVAGPHPGERIAPFSLATSDGGTRNWQPGKVTVLSFCAFWCDTWKEQNSRLTAARRALQGMPVEFLMISVDGRWAELGRDKITDKVLLDAGEKLAASLGINSVPYTMVVDAQGQVAYAEQGIIRSAALQQAIRGALANRATRRENVIYLTFNNFPSPDAQRELDDKLLDVLRAHKVKATFFCIGSRLASRKAVVQRALREGHILQVNAWDRQMPQPHLDRCAQTLLEITGVKPTLSCRPGTTRIFRLAAGRSYAGQPQGDHPLRGGEVRAVVVNPYDYTLPGEKELARRVLLAARPDSIIHLHAGVEQTMEALPSIIRSLRARGWRFETLR
jgi:peptidoglycan/xylan/chitin deacetylase (PgdA/CDA1 family)